MPLDDNEFADFLSKSVSDYESGKLDEPKADKPKADKPKRDWKGHLEYEGFPEPRYELYIASKSFPTLEKLLEYAEALGANTDTLKSGRQDEVTIKNKEGTFQFLVDARLLGGELGQLD
jgi:hypothetical protein